MKLEDYRVPEGKKLRLKDHDPDDTGPYESKQKAQARLAECIERLRALQEKLYAQDRWAVLLVFQAMDAAGKDSVIEHVMSGLNPQGCQVYAFKAPSSEELDHDFLWRTARCLPERGRIGVWNRSHYEEVLVVRVHPEILERQHLPSALVSKQIWQQRCEDIANWERYLSRNGVVLRKFFLNVSKQEQRERFLARLDEPAKNWKFAVGDVREREHWDEYQDAYQEALERTSTEAAPWYVIPADHKWFTRLLVAEVIVETLESLELSFPELGPAQLEELKASRALLEATK